jgi:hypothetical protein
MENEIKYSVEIKGVSPLLMNRFIPEQLVETKVRRGNAKEVSVEDKLYLTEDGKPYVPSAYIRNSLIDAGKAVKIKGKGKSTYSKLLGSSLIVQPDVIIINSSTGWKPFTATAVNPATRGRMTVTRPMFKDWKLEFEVIMPDDINEEDFAKIFDEAGRYVGIGDWRPAKKGMYGKFIVAKLVRE